MVFSAQWASEPTNIFSMRPGSREYRPLDLPEGRILAISSTGEMAILLGPTTNGTAGTLARVPLSGGAPREILENVNDADWSPDGSTLAVSRTVGGKNRIEYPIGTVRYESDGRSPELLRVSPKGDLIAFFEHDNDVGDYTVTVLDMNGKKRALSRGWQALGGLAWSPNGDEIWFGGAKAGGEPALRAVTLAGKERLVTETPASMLVDDITRDRAGGQQQAARRSWLRWWIRGWEFRPSRPAPKQESDLSWFDASRVYDISADGKTHPVRRAVLRGGAQSRDLHSQNRWLASGAAGRRQPSRVVAGWKICGLHLERRPEDGAEPAADGPGRVARFQYARHALRARGMVSGWAEAVFHGQ